MAVPESLLKTQQVAEALGVSVSTVKRWVDSGSLHATRTLGKHRLVPVSEAIRFAKKQNLPQAGLEALLPQVPVDLAVIDDTSPAALVEALKAGKEAESRGIILAAYAVVGNASRLADDLIRPAMEQIGHDWEVGDVDVYQEHRASRIVETALNALIARQPANSAASGAPLALGATPEGDLYTISGLLCELSLRELGWQVVNLGPNLPLSSMAKAVRRYQPTLIWLSVNYLAEPNRFIREYPLLYAESDKINAAICLGGPALSPNMRSRLIAASFGERVGHLAEFARRLRPATDHANSVSLSIPSKRIIPS